MRLMDLFELKTIQLPLGKLYKRSLETCQVYMPFVTNVILQQQRHDFIFVFVNLTMTPFCLVFKNEMYRQPNFNSKKAQALYSWYC